MVRGHAGCTRKGFRVYRVENQDPELSRPYKPCKSHEPHKDKSSKNISR